MDDGTQYIVLLRALATQARGRVRRVKLFDARVCVSPLDPHRPWEHDPLPGDLFSHLARMKHAGRTVQLLANRSYLAVEIKGEYRVPVCSVNRPDSVMGTHPTGHTVGDQPQYAFFSCKRDNDQKEFAESPEFQRLVRELRLGTRESLHVNRGALQVFISPSSAERVLQVLEVLSRYPQSSVPEEGSLQRPALPEEFQDLLPLAMRWAVSDDQIRSERLRKASKRALQHFVDAVQPRLTSINEHLDSFSDAPLPESACTLGTLAECSVEAQLELYRRTT